MKKAQILLLFLFAFGISFAQKELTKEEKELRKKNIEAGNPFAKFGYKAKVATLSNGKYLEVHDLDSIVTIGTVRFHVNKMQIVGHIQRDTLNPDAQPIGDVTGRWMSPDPLSEEAPDWTPYRFGFNNPIRYNDPTGLFEGDYYDSNGNHLGNDGIDDNKAYFVESVTKNKNGTVTSATGKVELSVTNSVLNQLANTVAEESSGNWKESFALASSIVNLSNYKGKSISSTLQTEGIYGYDSGGSSTSYNNNSEYGMQAALNAVLGGTDYSNGAIRWDGFDLAIKGWEHIKSTDQGIGISKSHFNTFENYWTTGNNLTSASGDKNAVFNSNFSSKASVTYSPATKGIWKGMVLYNSSAAHGGTIFWKGTSSFIISGNNLNSNYETIKGKTNKPL